MSHIVSYIIRHRPKGTAMEPITAANMNETVAITFNDILDIAQSCFSGKCIYDDCVVTVASTADNILSSLCIGEGRIVSCTRKQALHVVQSVAHLYKETVRQASVAMSGALGDLI